MKPDPADKRPPSPLIYRFEGWPDDGSENTLIEANGKRDFVVHLPVASAAGGKVARIAAQPAHVLGSPPPGDHVDRPQLTFSGSRSPSPARPTKGGVSAAPRR